MPASGEVGGAVIRLADIALAPAQFSLIWGARIGYTGPDSDAGLR